MVGHTTKVEERTSIKKSVIGKHCVIGKLVKILGCVILDHCVIADGYVDESQHPLLVRITHLWQREIGRVYIRHEHQDRCESRINQMCHTSRI